MAEIPEAMKANGREPDAVFTGDEDLYRRFSPDHLLGATVHVDAIELPDMSVNRQKYGPPDWALLATGCEHWGVAAFRVDDIPPKLVHRGLFEYEFRPEHRPLRYNYPHSEVRAYWNGKHIDLKSVDDLEPEVHLRWRKQLSWKVRIVIPPKS